MCVVKLDFAVKTQMPFFPQYEERSPDHALFGKGSRQTLISSPPERETSHQSTKISIGNVEKSHQRRSRHFAVLTYWKYAPRAKTAVALLGDFFDHSRQLLTTQFPSAFTSYL
ncbi:MAG: hypothetical protein WD425_08290 [Nitrospirales bacterium]